jgi:hypothetical protein
MSSLLGRRLVRTLNGVRIHRATCQWAKPGHVLTWAWADTVSDKELRATVTQLGMRPCKECDPLEGL